mmetsp:Transcript_13069/g.31893  ORF Transcript_13069/g.31893 Transcript_13069/m.31893 type:complete len:197 (+) Transcript_13069:404-994(+)
MQERRLFTSRYVSHHICTRTRTNKQLRQQQLQQQQQQQQKICFVYFLKLLFLKRYNDDRLFFFWFCIWPIASDPGIFVSLKRRKGVRKKGQVMDIRLLFFSASFSSKITEKERDSFWLHAFWPWCLCRILRGSVLLSSLMVCKRKRHNRNRTGTTFTIKRCQAEPRCKALLSPPPLLSLLHLFSRSFVVDFSEGAR